MSNLAQKRFLRGSLMVLALVTILLQPVRVDALSLDTLMSADKQKLQTIVSDLKAKLDENPRDHELLQSLGIAYHNLAALGIQGRSKQAVKYLKKANTIKNTPVTTTFLGSAWTLRGRDSSNPVNKVSFVNKGNELIDKGIQSDPDNIVLRLTRLNNGLNLPAFFGRADVALNDLEYIEGQYQSPRARSSPRS
jgi:hypothetical protein